MKTITPTPATRMIDAKSKLCVEVGGKVEAAKTKARFMSMEFSGYTNKSDD